MRVKVHVPTAESLFFSEAKIKQPPILLRGCLVVELNLLNRIFPFRKLSIFCGWLQLLALLRPGFEFSSCLRLLGFFVVSFRRHRLSATPSCLWCPLEFLAVAFGPYLFGSDLLAFVALKVLSNNHLHLLVIRFASLFLSFPLSDFPSFVFARLQGSFFHGFSSARVR